MEKTNRKNKTLEILRGIILVVAIVITISSPLDLVAFRLKGEHFLKKGMRGTDTDRLIMRLNYGGYLNLEDAKDKNGKWIYNGAVEDAVRHFQKDIGIRETGIFDLYYEDVLRYWKPEYSSIPLGFRKLSSVLGTTGNDVNRLYRLLREAGFTPYITQSETKTIKIDDQAATVFIRAGFGDYHKIMGHLYYPYTSDMERALKTFQAFHGLSPNGELTQETIECLLKYDKEK